MEAKIVKDEISSIIVVVFEVIVHNFKKLYVSNGIRISNFKGYNINYLKIA